MREPSAYHIRDRVVLGIATCLGAALISSPATASQVVQQAVQREQRNSAGQLTVERSIIYVTMCNGAGENGAQIYIYGYLDRPGFRSISPPNWGAAIGGRDFETFAEAAQVGCGSGLVAPQIPSPTVPAPMPPATPSYTSGFQAKKLANGRVSITWSGLPGVNTNWFAVVPAGTSDRDFGQNWAWCSQPSGSVEFGPLAPGSYEIRYYPQNDSQYVVAARTGFSMP